MVYSPYNLRPCTLHILTPGSEPVLISTISRTERGDILLCGPGVDFAFVMGLWIVMDVCVHKKSSVDPLTVIY